MNASLSSQHPEFLRRAVAPNLFTATLHPEFFPALIIANLMTPRLWQWAELCQSHIAGARPLEALAAIQHFLNTRFHHATGPEFAALWGLQERQHITDPDEARASDYAMSFISRCFSAPPSKGEWTLPLIPLLNEGTFPLYVYGTADLLYWQGRSHGRRNLGTTSCLDECVLAASLAIATGVCRWEDIAFLGSPVHYTVFCGTAEGPAWFNAKREMFTRDQWKTHISGQDDEGKIRCLMEKLVVADRLITTRGWVTFPSGALSGNRDFLQAASGQIEEFAQAPLAWAHSLPDAQAVDPFTDCDIFQNGLSDGARGVEKAVWQRARVGGAAVLEAALYMFRHPGFCDPHILQEAARHNFYTLLRSAALDSPADISGLLESVPGRESIFGPTGRLALPDEVLAFGTANAAERDLLARTVEDHLKERGEKF